MSDDNTKREAEPSPASAGSHGEPVGWQATDEFGRPSGFLSWRCGETRWPKSQTVPVYLQPQPTLTDEEREVLLAIESDAAYRAMERTQRVVRGILERLG
jgi:hypothetical protein